MVCFLPRKLQKYKVLCISPGQVKAQVQRTHPQHQYLESCPPEPPLGPGTGESCPDQTLGYWKTCWK